jgi:hypothetical protein
MAHPVQFLFTEEDHRMRSSTPLRAARHATRRDTGSELSEKRRGSRAFSWVAALALLLPALSGCAGDFARLNAGNAEMWIGEQPMVQRECTRRGVALYSQNTKILGCTDFDRGVIVSVQDPQIIAHEMCHWTLWTESHEACPLPRVHAH